MPDSKLIKKAENFARKYCRDEVIKSGYEDQNLWNGHVQLTRQYALGLAETEGAEKVVVEVAALLHDTGKYRGRDGHVERGFELAKEFLKNIDLPEDKRNLILKCISKHSSKYAKENNEIEVKVIQSADALGTLFDEEWQEYSRKTKAKEELLKLYDKLWNKINLASARKIAAPQIKKLKEKLSAL